LKARIYYGKCASATRISRIRSRGDHLVYHAVGHQRIVALVEVLDEKAALDPAPVDWEKRWPLILRVRPLLKIRRVSQAPPTNLLGMFELSHQSFVPLNPDQLAKTEAALKGAGAT
jgi:hypothetical protein